MNIEFKRDNEKYYEDVGIGDVFTCNGHVYMLTDQPERENDTGGELKCVNLANGEMQVFDGRKVVTMFDNVTCVLE